MKRDKKILHCLQAGIQNDIGDDYICHYQKQADKNYKPAIVI